MDPSKHIFVIIEDAAGRRYTIEVPQQQVSIHKIRSVINNIGYHPDFVAGHLTKDDVLNMFRMNGIAANFKSDFQIMYMKPKVRQELMSKSTKDALDLVQDVIAQHYKVPAETLRGRKKDVMRYKEMFCFIARTRIPNAPWKEITDRMGYKTHAVAIHHCKKIQGWIDAQDHVATIDVEEIDRKVAAAVLGDPEKAKELNIEM